MEENKNDFVLPEEFKDVQAVQGCKSVEDLCKKIVDDESFIGKLKSERAMPTETDGEDVWNTFFGKVKAVADKQDWSDIDESFAKVAKDAGLVKQQTKPILDFIEAQKDKEYDGDEWEAKKAEVFKGREGALAKIDSMLSRVSEESLNALNNTKNDQLINVYGVLAELAEKMAVKESPATPSTTGTPDTTKVFNSEGKLNPEALAKMQDEILALPNTPNRQELKEEIFKKYGWQA